MFYLCGSRGIQSSMLGTWHRQERQEADRLVTLLPNSEQEQEVQLSYEDSTPPVSHVLH